MKKMLTVAKFINLTQEDVDHLSNISGLTVDVIPLRTGRYMASVVHIPTELDKEGKELFADFIRDSIRSDHE
ncbi:hypothetical protein HOD96_03715 [Candidatus Falkowbacteria bacterium]|jgi:hypothetical protein|nr:hypothetical protein [Candidatus Falkowbacteria bacterium]MBT4432914.1 hypothetical protein [Candidatus Falkowbacteria bacterium]